jgi:SAM-dependent methyltransferase
MNSDYDGYFERQFGRGGIISERDVVLRARWSYAQCTGLFKRLNVRPEHKLLEVGSGLGSLYSNLPYKGNYLGLEIDERAASFTNEYFQTRCFLNTSIEEFPEDEQFDLIFAFEVLEHLHDPLGAIEKMLRLLRPGGSFCGTSPYPYRRYVAVDTTHLFLLHPENWARLFTAAGFREVAVQPASYLPFLWRLSKRGNKALPFYVPFRHVLSTTLIIADA